jgi:small GTP-binding protein
MIHPRHDEARLALLAEQRRVLREVEAQLGALGADAGLARTLADSVAQLDEGFLLVLVGEFNAGKSALINALVGAPLLEEGVTPTTARITRLRYSERDTRHVAGDGIETIGAPAEVLRAITIVDTPGTNAVLRQHEVLTREFVPRADLVVFLSSADRPFSETERAFLAALREWGKKLVLVVNKADLLDSPADVERVLGFVREQARATLGQQPEVLALSARRALRARTSRDEAGVAASGLAAFETRVTAGLDELERFRLKLLNPAGIAERVLRQLDVLVAGRLELLAEDVVTLEALSALLGDHGERLGRDFRLRLSDVERVLLDFEQRGNAFFDERIRLPHLRELFDRERLRREFEAAVVAELPREVERRVSALVDWMVTEDLALWQEVMRLLRARHAAHAERPFGAVDDRFSYDRQERLVAVGREAQRSIEGYDGAAEGRRLAAGVRDSLAGAALLQVSGLGLGAIVAALASTTAADVSGFLAAGTLVVLGLLVLPARRRRARRELARKAALLRAGLVAALSGSFERERERGAARVRAAVEPYAGFVAGERRRLEQARARVAQLAGEVAALRVRAESFGR